MHRIDTATRAVDLFGPGKHGFKNGNPLSGDPATALNAEWFNAIQEEIANVVEGASAALDPEANDQLLSAIRHFIGNAAPVRGVVVFDQPGVTNWVVPADVRRAYVRIIGGGGSGRGNSGNSTGGSGGGAGGVAEELITGLVPGETISITVGAGGVAATAPAEDGGNGGTSSFGPFCSATGGAAGTSTGGPGGIGVGGTLNYSLGDGSPRRLDDANQGGNGGGPGGAGGASANGTGQAGKAYGGGGGGGSGIGKGGNGAPGVAIIWY